MRAFPQWRRYKHHQHVELEGSAHSVFEKALARLAEVEVVGIFERCGAR